MLDRRKDIIEETKKWIGTPWAHQGRSIYGLDCAGLIIVVGKKLGHIPSDFTYNNYPRRTTGMSFLNPFKELFDRKDILQSAPGDIMLFRDAAYPCHSAIISEREGHQTIIHADAFRRKVIEEFISQGDWLERRVACFEFRREE